MLTTLRELQREKAWSRIHLVPLLLAESDRDVYRRNFAALEREKEIMKDMPEWEVRFPHFFSSLDNRNQFIENTLSDHSTNAAGWKIGVSYVQVRSEYRRRHLDCIAILFHHQSPFLLRASFASTSPSPGSLVRQLRMLAVGIAAYRETRCCYFA